MENRVGLPMIVLIYISCFLCVISFITNKLQINTSTDSDSEPINWEELYPFTYEDDGEAYADSMLENTSQSHSYISQIGNMYSKMIFFTNNFLDNIGTSPKYLPGYERLKDFGSNLKFLWSDALRDHIDSSSYAKTKDGYFVNLSAEESVDSLKLCAENVSDFSNYCVNSNIPFLYVQCASKISYDDGEYIEDYTNVNKDRYVSLLRGESVDVLDIRELISGEDLNWHSLFYYSDHHWTARSGLWAAKELITFISSKYNIDAKQDALDASLYEMKVFEKAMFGSAGQTLGHAYVENEDLEIPIPKFETCLRIQNMDKGIDITGSFDKVIYDEDEISSMQDEGGGYAYEVLLGGNRPLTQITNLNNPDGLKVVMIRDSFSLAVVPYLAPCVSELYLIDVRKEAGNFNGSIKSLIEQTQPDMVIMMLSSPPIGYSFK